MCYPDGDFKTGGSDVHLGDLHVDGLEKPMAFVQLGPGGTADEETLIRFCRDGLPSFKRPRRIVFVTEYPTTATGKIRRVELRAQAATIMAAPVSAERAPADPVPLQPGR